MLILKAVKPKGRELKILMLGWELPPYNSGGLGVACYNLCKALARFGVEIDFVVPYNTPHTNISFMKVIPALPYSIEELRMAGNAYDSQAFVARSFDRDQPLGLRQQQQQYAQSVAQLVKNGKYDIVHAHDWLTYEAAMAARPHTTAPIIAHVHATEFDRSGEHYGDPLVHEVEYQGLLFADHIVAVSQFTKNILVREYKLPADKIEVIHNSIDPDDFVPIATQNIYTYLQHMKARGYKVVVSTNRFTVQKGLTYLLKAAQLAIHKNPKLLFLLCGSGEQYHELIQLTADLGISSNVLFTGFVRGKQLRDAYEVADMFVMSSVSEPFGIAALEAVGYGDVTLASKQSGVCEVVHSMLKFDYWDTLRLADQIVAVAEHDSLATTLRAEAKDEFAHFSWEKVAAKCQSLYAKKLQLAEAPR